MSLITQFCDLVTSIHSCSKGYVISMLLLVIARAECTILHLVRDNEVQSNGMGTELQYAINPLATNSFSQLDSWDFFREKGNSPRSFSFEELASTMLEQRYTESIKKTMLMHEDIFKQQVRELHRLYRVQRMLMDINDDQQKQSQLWGTNILLEMNNSGLVRRDHSLRNVIPSSQECTASSSSEALRIPNPLDLQKPAEANMPTGISANDDQTGFNFTNTPLIETHAKGIDDGSDEDSNETEVELTLSIGPSTVRRSSRRCMSQHSPHVGSSSGSIKKQNGKECSEPDDNMASSSIIFDQESKRSHWLFQDLSLNRT